MKNYSTMNTMQCFSSTNSLSNSSKDSKQMFLTARRDPLIPSTYHTHHRLQPQSSINQSQNYPCVHPHHTVLSTSCSPSISSNSINIWTTINNPSGIKQGDKVPHYSALTTLGRLNTHKNDENSKDIKWKTNEKKFCFLLLVIGCILTFILLIFSLIFYFIVFKQGISFGIDISNDKNSSSFINANFKTNANNLNFKTENGQLPSFLSDKIKQQTSIPEIFLKKKRKRLINKIEGEFRISNKPYLSKNNENEVTLIKQNLNYFILHKLGLCLNNTEITNYRKGENHNLNGIIVNFILSFSCASPNLAKRLAGYFKESFKNNEYHIDFRTLRLSPLFDDQFKEYVEVTESENDSWTKISKKSEWQAWSDWSKCDCAKGLFVKSRQRNCLNKTTNKSFLSFVCSNADDDNDDHLPSLEIKNCDCEEMNETNLNLSICEKCEKNSELCLSIYNQIPSCLKILSYNEQCGGYCNSKGNECKFVKESNMYQCNQVDITDVSSCLNDEFRCSNGLCIPNIKHCDGHFNCYDSSDEYNCSCDLQSGEYMHCGNNTSCIHISKRCNEVYDCWDQSDEKNCFSNCPVDEDPQFFHCTSADKECIPIEKVCDDHRDCKDGSDELECSNKDFNNNLHSRSKFNITESLG